MRYYAIIRHDRYRRTIRGFLGLARGVSRMFALRTLLGIVILVGIASVGFAADDEAGSLQPIPDPAMGPGGLAAGAASEAARPIAGEPVFDRIVFGQPSTRFWFRTDYLYWWTKGEHAPPLVTTSTTSTLPSATDPAGAVGTPGTTIVAGNSLFNANGKSGLRIGGGFWLDACQLYGIEADYLNVGGNGEDDYFSSNSFGSPIYARPYYDVENGRNWRQLVSYPNEFAGNVEVASSDYFNSAGVALRRNLFQSGCCPTDPCNWGCRNDGRLDFLIGYRYYGLSDKLVVHENIRGLGALAGTTIDVVDSFRTQNDFNGVDLGFDARANRGRWTYDFLLKAALGNTHRTTVIGGQTVRQNSSGQIVDPAGVYAVATNAGKHENDDFTVIPQIGLEMGYQITPRLRVYTGYNLIYWGAVQRAADAIDTNIDPRNIPGGTAPGATHFPEYRRDLSSFWAQGGNVGFEVQF